MAAIALTSFLGNDGKVPKGTIVTVVFPGGCQLKCPFCIVRHRDERYAGPAALPPSFFVDLLKRYINGSGLAGGAIVGDEPLQDSVWPYVQEFLATCDRAGRPSAMITNGVELRAFAANLETFTSTRVLVSVDAIGAAHDELRGKAGLFDMLLSGIVSIPKGSDLYRRLTIATILRPGKRSDAEAVLRLVAKLGMKRWLLSPLLDPRPNRPIQLHSRVAEEFPDAVRHLGDVASELGVTLVASDEFGLIDDLAKLSHEGRFVAARPNSRPALIRVDAQGRASTWDELRGGGNIKNAVELAV